MTLNERSHITDAEYAADPQAGWDKWIDALGGTDAVRPYLPYDLKSLSAMYLKDRHLNGKPADWDRAAGYAAKMGSSREERRAEGQFPAFLIRNGVTVFSESECVCLLKRCAERCVLEALGIALPEYVWAVFESSHPNPDRFNAHNVFDYDCIRSFLDERDAIEYENQNPEYRVRKLVRLTGLFDAGEGGAHESR